MTCAMNQPMLGDSLTARGNRSRYGVTTPASGNAVLGIDIYMAASAGIGKQASAIFRMNCRIGAAMKNDRTRRSIDRIR